MAAPDPSGDRSWADLPPDLLGLVLLRLPSHADRIRLPAVCRPWRSGARLQAKLLPPLLPWLVLPDGTFLTLPDGAVHCLPVTDDVTHLVSIGSDLLLTNGGVLSLMNPSSSSSSPRAVAEWKPPAGGSIVDIALFQGKLYCLAIDKRHEDEELYILGVFGEQPMVSDFKCIHSPSDDEGDDDDEWFKPYSADSYVSGDRLLMVRRWINLPPMLPRDSGIVERTRCFEVFEAVDGLTGGGCGRWIKVDALMGHALFVSSGCSRSLANGAGEDCIYFLHDDIKYGMPEDPFLDCGVYSMRDGMVAPLLPETAAAEPLAEYGGPWFPT
uniref:KIB1-4 beta-propeller domain-containing protein n=1 Tax=Oryza brachyantha TaxID=4533 RepID=J3MBA3_ORYBR